MKTIINLIDFYKQWFEFIRGVKWNVVAGILLLHIGAIRGLIILCTDAKWETVIICYIFSLLSGIGVLAGAHRFFSHRSYKANRKLTFLLCVLQTLSGQFSIIDWTLDHHTHHKFEGTNADAVSLNRGFFFAHIGWMFVDRHPECEEKRQKLNVDYLWSDPFVKFQFDYYWPLFVLINVIIPTIVPSLLFGETLVNSFYTCFCFRHAYTMQLALSGNSFAHIYGYKEYDKESTGAHNKPLNYLTLGGAYHNYHHSFPYDYSASEYGIKSFNVYSAFIEFFAWIGWAYDLKKAPKHMVESKKERTGCLDDINAIHKTSPIIDWMVGWIISFNIVWTVIVFRSVINVFPLFIQN